MAESLNLTAASPSLALKGPDLRLRVDSPNPNLLRINGSGPKGEKGDPPDVSHYKMSYASIVNGVLALDCSDASTFYVFLNQNVFSISFDNWPVGERSQVIKIYVQQGDEGGYTLDGWPFDTLWPAGFMPQVSAAPGTIDCFVVDSFDEGATIFANLVARDYKRRT